MRRLWWRWVVCRRCTCGFQRIVPGTGLELHGVKHRTDGPCFLCDDYGEPL